MIDFPITLHFFGYDVLLHPIMESLGIFLAMRYYYFLKRSSSEKMLLTVFLAILIGAIGGALLGSKLIGNLEDSFSFFSHPFNLKEFWSGNTIVGELAFALIGIELTKKW